MDKIDHLRNAYENFKNDETLVFEKIKSPDNRYHYIPTLEGYNIIMGLHALYMENNLEKAKRYYYKAAHVAEYMSRVYDRRIVDSGINQISYAMLSDNPELIHRYTLLRNKVNHESGIGYNFTNSVQNILLNNWEKLDWNIHCLERLVKVPRFNGCEGVLPVLNGFKHKDQKLITVGLKQLLATHKKRNNDPLISRFFSTDTAGFCKLAWIKGYEIDLKSSFVPIELMPVKPLEHYEDYEFLNNKA